MDSSDWLKKAKEEQERFAGLSTTAPATAKNMTGLANDKRTEQDTLITNCEQRDEQLTEWEANFIQSIREKFDAGFFLSDKQLAVLDKIWVKVTDAQPRISRKG